MRSATWSRSGVLKPLSLCVLLLVGCAAATEGRVTTTTQTRIDNRAPPTNWGKNYAANRGMVEYVRLKFPEPRDITLYLGQPNTQMFNYALPNPYVVSVGSGGTSFDYFVGRPGVLEGEQSIRGTVLHFCADELYVRGDTSVFPGAPASVVNSLRFGAQAGLGTPSEFQRMRAAGKDANGDAVMTFQLTPWATHARLDWAPASGGLGSVNAITNFTVRQTCTNPAGTTDVTPEMPFSLYMQGKGVALHPFANGLAVTTTGGGGPPPAGPAAGAIYRVFLTETYMY